MRIFTYISKSEKDTQKIARALARSLEGASSVKHAIVIALKGELGSGKTTFAKGFAKGLGIKNIIKSPTFILVKKYKLQSASRRTNYKLLLHIDAYRLRGGKDMQALGWNEWINNPENIVLVEWADRVKDILPKRRFEIRFRHKTEYEREITFYVF